ncbi:MAG: glutamine-hydrolyzing carbamoyl-phosphate synthase small subunit [Hafnia sp.]|uniref:glutamine-hydrolyzing carbamoyl-phosphate synthase small subunit n=1 Tax=Hafnia paralvei TaxID=546367 RepID=UPI0007E30BDC|nr:glutamine-hydrolyzing carbamoyl-phosphate synthase small subunit [Hafnia paralvei]MDU1192854.1 glutamine-hydrolyzing carbamoyl-phosphate synthase small subunit [Enterobacteriaceae bacterium]MBU2672351.1 glutamine-hydrolyzing carbamoyl-phosphate synthase small subunit [Hafnia paralvei]MCE9880756.1 glutamine-hydrolyzing carbamoyl-phosphate synthase small subunit [Hafnia paralvei]MCE9906375.1 glutamine-hydrolyzing carbamoyl-phosphate synthase small subunit [Hafnia paralvei]MCE9911575.1 glutami
MIKSAILVLEDGTQFHGRSIGADGSAVGEVVFNTSMTGYQEILTDPSYSRQLVTLTYPHIGNVGTNASDEESSAVHAQGLIIRDLPLIASNYRSTESLSDYLKRHNVVAIADIDTRKLTRLLREKGAQNGCIITGPVDGSLPDAQLALEKARAFPGLKGMDLAKEVTTRESYAWTQGSWTLMGDLPAAKEASELPFHVVAYDYGVKRNILRMLVDRGCRLTVVPAQTPAEDVLKLNPDGIFLSNGPGDPEPCDYAIRAIKTFLDTDIPVFGICLGHQLLALASGAKTIKMKLGHHGGNHPVKDLDKNVVMITAQNHGFAVDGDNLPQTLRITHTSLFDHTVQGIHRTDKAAFSFQGHPEASPGPHDAAPLFDHFIDLIQNYRSTGSVNTPAVNAK